MVDHTVGSKHGADPFVDDQFHFEHPFDTVHLGRDRVADMDGGRGLGRRSVDTDVAAMTRISRSRAGGVQAHGPQPFVDTSRIHLANTTESPELPTGHYSSGTRVTVGVGLSLT